MNRIKLEKTKTRFNIGDMTRGNLWVQILFFSIPLVMSNLLQIMFNIADVMVVGRFAGAEALGSVGCTTNLVALFVSFVVGIGSAVNVYTARYIGAGKKKDIEETVHTSVALVIIVGFILAAISIVFAGPLLELMNTKSELIAGAKIYIRLYFCGMPAMAVYNCGSAIYSASGNTRKPLVFLSLSGIVNIFLNLFFVIVCRMGAAGVGLASALAQWLAALLIICSLVKCKADWRINLKSIRIVRDKAGDILRLGIASGFQFSVFQIANVFIQTAVNSFDAVTVEGAAASANADNIVYDIMAAFYTACSSFIGQNYGAGNKKRIRNSYMISMFYSVGVAFLLGILLTLYGRQFLSLFTNNQPVIEKGLERLAIMSMSYCVSGFMDCSLAASRGLGKTFVPNIVIILGSCVFRIIWIYTVFAAHHTIAGLYLLYVFSWALSSIGEITYFIYIYRKQTAML